MINVKNVYFSYDKCSTLTDISFNISKGEFVAVIGSNGAGKSTLCRLLNGLLKPTSGSVTVNGMDTKATRSSSLAKHVGYLFQNPDRQICKNTVRDEILFGVGLAKKDKDLREYQLKKTLSLFNLDANRNPFNLSRGERQQVALASIIAMEPEILVLDEPTTGLDYAECMKVMNIIKKLNEKGVTVVMVSHDMEVVNDFAKRVLVLAEGSLLADGHTKEIMRMQDVLKRASVLPTQITCLAMQLGNEFDDVHSVEEMVRVIMKKMNTCKKEGKRANERFSELYTG